MARELGCKLEGNIKHYGEIFRGGGGTKNFYYKRAEKGQGKEGLKRERKNK